MKIAAGSTLLMTGDSITDAGRARPVGRGAGLGDGYVALVSSLLAATYPERGVRVLNTGIGGDTTRHLSARWQRDVVDLQPNWLSIMIGINDVWRQFDGYDSSAAVPPDEFERNLSSLVSSIRPNLDGLVLMTPFYAELNPADPMRARTDEYGQIVRQVAVAQDCFLVETQRYFDWAAESIDPLQLAYDRVHPTPTGSALLARAFLRALDFEL